MSLINHRAREIHVKIVYYGPGLGGKTTNVKMLHERLPADRRGRLVTIATEQERTLFFDFMPVDLGVVNGFTTRFHLYTVPGQIYYRRSRRAVLQGVDGIVFVADSQSDREADNLESLADMHLLLGHVGLGPAQIARLPRVIQYNKRDVGNVVPVERMRALYNPEGLPDFEAVAIDGKGVSETMRAIAKGVLGRITGLTGQGPQPTGHPVAAAPVAVTPPVPALVAAAPVAPAPVAVPVAAASAAPPPAPSPFAGFAPRVGAAPASRPTAPRPAVAPQPRVGAPPAARTASDPPVRPLPVAARTIVPVPGIGPVRPVSSTPPAPAAAQGPASPRTTPVVRRGPFRRIAPTRT